MSDIIVTGSSGYATGSIDSATVLISNVSTISARHPNGCASAIVQVETILGSGTALKGTQADLATRLAVALNPTGTHALTGFTGLTIDRGLTAISATELQVMNVMPIGSVLAFGGVSAPANWLLCDGQAVSRTTYLKLFQIIGVLYGVGNGSTTFNVPDRRGRVGIGVDGTANRVTVGSPDTLGGTGGSEFITTSNMPSHNHTIDTLATGGGGNSYITAAANATTIAIFDNGVVNNAGSGTAYHDPYQTFNYIIFAGV